MALTDIEYLKALLKSVFTSNRDFSSVANAALTVQKLWRRTFAGDVTDGGTAGTAQTETTIVPRVQRKAQVVAAYVGCPVAVTANDTNYATVTLSKRTAGGAATVLATQTTKITGGSGNITAFAPVSLTLSATPSDLILAEGATITALVSKAGTGVAIAAATSQAYVEVEIEEIG